MFKGCLTELEHAVEEAETRAKTIKPLAKNTGVLLAVTELSQEQSCESESF
jgi:hypothetical protein